MSMRVAAALAALLMFAVAHSQSSFPDVPERHWAEDSVARLADLGILVGYPDGTFRGNERITRYEAALVIDRLLTAVQDESTAADAAIENQVATLRAVVTALAAEAEELQRRTGANRQALDALWAEVQALRAELGLPPPAPLPSYPPDPSDDDAPAPPGRPAEDAAPQAEAAEGVEAEEAARDDAAAEEPRAAPPSEEGEVAADEPEDPTGPERPAEEAPAEEGSALDEVEPAGAVRQPTVLYASVAGGGAVPRRWLVRATVGVENLVADGFGARLSLDLGRRSPAPLASVTILGHATYRLVEPDPLGAYLGAGLGVHLGGDGALASVLAGGTWSVADPVLLFAEATLDVYLAPALPSGGSRFGPTLVVGARWTF